MLDEQTENSDLIGSDRVDGTAVYDSGQNKIGTVRRLLIDKTGGQVRDVELSLGGFLGMGGELHAIPWSMLDYNLELVGYQLDVTEDQLKAAPTYRESDRDTLYNRDYQTRTYEYWAVSPYW